MIAPRIRPANASLCVTCLLMAGWLFMYDYSEILLCTTALIIPD
jgi:hypothetical protein